MIYNWLRNQKNRFLTFLIPEVTHLEFTTEVSSTETGVRCTKFDYPFKSYIFISKNKYYKTFHE